MGAAEELAQTILDTGKPYRHLGIVISRIKWGPSPFIIRAAGHSLGGHQQWGSYASAEDAVRILRAKSFNDRLFETLLAIIGQPIDDDAEVVELMLICCE